MGLSVFARSIPEQDQENRKEERKMKEIMQKPDRRLRIRMLRVAYSLTNRILLLGRQVLRLTLSTLDYVTAKLGHQSLATSRPIVRLRSLTTQERGDVPGWVLVVLMTTGLVTAIWAIAAPKLNMILKNSLDSMGNIR